MKVFYRLNAPSELQAELKIVATIGEFRGMLSMLDKNNAAYGSPLYELRFAVLRAISDAETVFSRDTQKQESK